MSKIFDNAILWTKETGNILGLPRPYFFINKYWRKRNGKAYLPRRVPIPWQSIAVFDKTLEKLNLDEEKEKLVYKNNLCAYCGLKIIEDENVTRWTNANIQAQDGVVLSDLHPFHLECMRQARMYCPFMRTVSENEFEYGLYRDLKLNAEKYLKDNNIKH